ncbi:conserved hypothetical protein [Culex quinquefasciatus]|uniref:Uncharacterized protein n=1 Tax=Culex quinquefasciatus TaxID=7176 RepID=B0WS28_CULQU|nr:conserved hypothetical protein [Culex quinquefasciatus]|eukprot:XP_001851512.1 conserved hypothetical protein [Culex quinquefasciatus]
MGVSVKLVFCAVALLATIAAAPSSIPSKKSTIGELVEIVEEYRVLFEELSQEKDQMLAFARTGLFASYRHMNEAILENLGETRNTIEYGFDELRTDIAAAILDGGDEDCLLGLASEIRDEQRALATGMSICSQFTTDVKDDLSYSFYEVLELLQRLSTALSEYTTWSFSTHNSVTDPQEHAEYLRRTYVESRDMWEYEVLPIIQFQIDAIEYNRPIVVDDNMDCLEKIVDQMPMFEEYIRGKMETCAEPFKAALGVKKN